jgi:hypothetical protein
VPLSRNLGTLTSWNLLGHSRPVTELLYLYLYKMKYVAVLYTVVFGGRMLVCSDKELIG